MEQSQPDLAPVQTDPTVELAALEKSLRSGASWFYWIAGLSLVNTVVQWTGSEWGFVLGLGVTQILDAIAAGIREHADAAVAMVVRIVALGFSVVIAGVFVMFGWFASRRQDWAFVVGLVLYVLDGFLFLLAQDWMGLGFHALAAFFVYRGYSALRALRTAERLAYANMPAEDAGEPHEPGPPQMQ